jgi:hypothetical protein
MINDGEIKGMGKEYGRQKGRRSRYESDEGKEVSD